MHCKCYENHILSMKMSIRIEHRIFDQIVTSVRIWPKNGNPPPPPRNTETSKTIVCQTAPLAKLPPGEFLFIHEIWRCQTKCRFVYGMECINFKYCTTELPPPNPIHSTPTLSPFPHTHIHTLWCKSTRTTVVFYHTTGTCNLIAMHTTYDDLLRWCTLSRQLKCGHIWYKPLTLWQTRIRLLFDHFNYGETRLMLQSTSCD